MGLRDYQDEKADVILKCANGLIAAHTLAMERTAVLAAPCTCMAGCCSLLFMQDVKVVIDMSHRYMADEARSLKAYGELPDSSESPPPKFILALHKPLHACCLLGDEPALRKEMLIDSFAAQSASTRRIHLPTRTAPTMSTSISRTYQVWGSS